VPYREAPVGASAPEVSLFYKKPTSLKPPLLARTCGMTEVVPFSSLLDNLKRFLDPQEVRYQLLAFFGEHTLGMELHTLHGKLAMP
jgi:hypothetical protein